MSIDTELAKVRAALQPEGILPLLGNVRRYAQQPDGYGGHVESWIADTGSIPLRKFSLMPQQMDPFGERIVNKDDALGFAYPADVDLHLKDRVLIGFESYEVQAIAAVHDYQLHNRFQGVLVSQPYTAIVGGSTTLQPVHALQEDSWDFFHPGQAVVQSGSGHRRVNGNWNVKYVAVSANVPPNSGPTTFDVKVNGSSIFGSVAKPVLGAGVEKSVSAQPQFFQLNDGGDMTVDTISIADFTNPGTDITVQVVVTPRT